MRFISSEIHSPDRRRCRCAGSAECTIAAFIKDVSHYDAGPESVQLAAAGWPLHGIDESAVSQ
jgi:hypothetical protein